MGKPFVIHSNAQKKIPFKVFNKLFEWFAYPVFFFLGSNR